MRNKIEKNKEKVHLDPLVQKRPLRLHWTKEIGLLLIYFSLFLLETLKLLESLETDETNEWYETEVKEISSRMYSPLSHIDPLVGYKMLNIPCFAITYHFAWIL